jgi:hypothetical protein
MRRGAYCLRMILKCLRRLGFAAWLGLLALTASGVAQNQLSTNVLVAALTTDASGGHMMPDGTYMAGKMAQADHQHGDHHAPADGHTHKGHSDCTMCSTVAAMAGLSVSVIATLPAVQTYAVLKDRIAADAIVAASSPASYSSRAPPTLIG